MSEPSSRASGRWSVIAGAAVAGFLVFSVGMGLVVLPALQAPNAGLDPWTAICRAVGVRPGSPAQPQPPVSARAAPVSQVRWTPETMKILADADPAPGAQLAQAACANCHGENGQSLSPAFPHLSGQSAQAIYKQLSDFRSGARFNTQMTPVARQLTQRQLAQVAAYFAAAGRQAALRVKAEFPDPQTRRLASRGDPDRAIAPCEACHARGSGGPVDAPVLRGQQAEYITRQLELFATGARQNDVYRRMRDIAQRLTPDERQKLGMYYQGLG